MFKNKRKSIRIMPVVTDDIHIAEPPPASVPDSQDKPLPKPIKMLDNMARHASMAISMPLGYAWLPFSFCCVMPTVRYALTDDEIYGKERKELSPVEKFAINFSGIILGFMSLVSGGCCCLGCCGMTNPNDVYS